MFQRDPISVPFEPAAARFIEHVITARGEWYARPVRDPTMRQVLRALADWGIRVEGRDTHTARKARTRWMRAFVRALERAANDYGVSIEWEVGRHVPALGLRPAGRLIRVRTRQRKGARRAAERKPDAERIWVGDHEPGGRFAHPELRDWGEAGN